MRLVTAGTGFLLAVIFSAAGGPSLSSIVFSPESRTTELVGRACQTELVSPELGRSAEQVKRCPGLGGARVVVSTDSANVSVGFEWSGTEKAEDVVRNWSLGSRLEWRGSRSARGFEPYAATIRVLFNDASSPGRDRPVLAVMRVKRGESCVIALADIAANPDAYELGRRAADERARSFACGRDTARVLGTPTQRVSELPARL